MVSLFIGLIVAVLINNPYFCLSWAKISGKHVDTGKVRIYSNYIQAIS